MSEMSASIVQRWTSRKFWAAMICWLVVVWLRVFNHIPVEAFVNLTWLLLGGYFLGNVAQSYILNNVKKE